MIAKLMRSYRRWNLRRRGARIAPDVQSESRFVKGDARGLTCGPGCYFNQGCLLILTASGKLSLGPGVFINHYAIIDCQLQIDIGERVMIGPYVYISDFQHDLTVTKGTTALPGTDSHAPVRIGAHAWIGAHAIIMKGITIGEGAIIGAGSVVTHDIPAMHIAHGVPARAIRPRTAADL